MLIDLHMHSTVSDGSDTPEKLAENCRAAGLGYCALTDHDTIDGVSRFLASAKKEGLYAMTGVEFTVAYDGELHILGLGFDHKDAALNRRLRELAKEREARAERITDRLRKNGYDIAFSSVTDYAGKGVVGRPHIARALVEAGYAASVADAFRDFLSKGKPGWVERHKIDSDEAIALIKGAGGVTVWAHPAQAHCADPEAMLLRLKSEGLFGIEAFYPTHTDGDVSFYTALAEKHGLLMTQGSDYHGEMRHNTAICREQRGKGIVDTGIIRLFENHIKNTTLSY